MYAAQINSTARTATSRMRGFTLIELMIVCAIVGILLAIALPSYALFMKQSRRGSAEAVLMDIAQRQQQYLIDARAYAPSVAALGTTTPVDVSTYYTINTAPGAGLPPTFTATATPKPGTPQAGDPTLSIDNTGAKLPVGVW
jgi:type IV pilus assembly protein PilE